MVMPPSSPEWRRGRSGKTLLHAKPLPISAKRSPVRSRFARAFLHRPCRTARQGPTAFLRPQPSLRSYLLYLLFKLVVVDKDRARLWICRFSAFAATTCIVSWTVRSRAFACFCKRDNLRRRRRAVDKSSVMPKSSPELSFDSPSGIWERRPRFEVMHCSNFRQGVVSPLKTRTWLTSTGKCQCYPQSCPMIVGRSAGRSSDGNGPPPADLQKIF